MIQNKILIDSIYINNSGGKVLLDYLIDSIIKRGFTSQFYFLLDSRGKYSYLDKIEYEFGANGETFRKRFYKKHKQRFIKVLCFGNVPPPVKLNSTVYTYFHNALLATSIKGYPLKTKVLKYFKRLYIKKKSKNTDIFLVQSTLMKNLVVKYINNTNEVKLFPFFYLKNELKEVSKKNIQFVYISDGNPHKNHNLLLDVWVELSEEGINRKLHLTVTDNYPSLVKRIEALKNDGINIENHGYTNVEKLFNKCTFLIYPSLIESFGLGLVEAVNAGLKIIAADLPYVNEVVEPSLVFNPLDKQSIMDAVKESLSNKSLKESKISIDNNINELIQLLITDK